MTQESEDVSMDAHDAPPAPPPIEYHFVSGPPLPRLIVPYLTSAREWQAFWSVLSLIAERRCAVTLHGRPPAQHLHMCASDFQPKEEVLAAIQEYTQPRADEEFRVERVKLINRCQAHSHSWNVQLIERTMETRDQQRAPPLDVAVHTGAAVTTIVCAIVPICFLYKPSEQRCPLHHSMSCSRLLTTRE
jgi:hypothetical protein